MKVISSQELFKGKLHGIREILQDEEGRQFPFELIRHPGAVVILPLMADGSIFLISQYRHAVRSTILELPAGTLEVGESPIVCAHREIREEIGYDASEMISLGTLHPAPGFCDEIQYLFLARGLYESSAAKDPDEVIETKPMSLAEVQEAIVSGLITDAKTIATIFRAKLNNYF